MDEMYLELEGKVGRRLEPITRRRGLEHIAEMRRLLERYGRRDDEAGDDDDE